jgi:hypothetical protein
MENNKKSRALQITKTQMEKCEVLQIAVAEIQLQQKAYNKFGTKPKLGRRRRRRRRNFSSKLQDTAWKKKKKKKKLELWTCCCCCRLAECKPSSQNFTLCIFVVPPSLTPFLSSFLPSFLCSVGTWVLLFCYLIINARNEWTCSYFILFELRAAVHYQ